MTVISEEAFKTAESTLQLEEDDNRKIKKCKRTIKKYIQDNETKRIEKHVSTLIKQGSFMELLLKSEEDATWKSFNYCPQMRETKFISPVMQLIFIKN